MFAHRDGVGIGCDLFDPLAGFVAGESESGFDFCVLGKILGVVEVNRGTRSVDLVGTLLGSLECCDDVVRVGHEERSGVDQNAAVVLSGDFKSPKHRLGECVLDRVAFSGVVGTGAEVEVHLLQQDARTDPLKFDHAAFTKLATIESDVVGSDAGGK